MQKYDDFGRPIYETAEEYNKAMKAANNYKIYDDPQEAAHNYTSMNHDYQKQQSASQRYTTSEGSKKAKVLVAGVIAFIVAVNVIIIFSVFSNIAFTRDESYWEEEEYYEEDMDDYGEFIGDDETPLPEGFDTFSVNGQTYTLPTSFDEVQTLEYSMDMQYDEHDLIPSEFYDTINFHDENDNLIVMVGINNDTDEDIPLGECVVDYFYIENPAVFYDDDNDAITPDLVFGDGLTFDSSYEDLEAYFGTPYYHYEDHSDEDYYYDSYEWTYNGDDELHFVMVTFWNGEISDVSIQRTVWE